MSTRPLIGLSVALGAHGNLHSDTFLSAVAWWRTHRAASARRFQFDLQSDDATHQGGHRVAQHFTKRGAACVVGHYSSAAAFQALETYTRTNTFVVLPAATDDRLAATARTPHGTVALRFSADNDRLMRHAAEQLSIMQSRSVTVFVEPSLYAQRLLVLLHRHAAPFGLRLEEATADMPSDVTCILGKEAFTHHAVTCLLNNPCLRDVMVFDDAVTDTVRNLARAAPTVRFTGLVAHTDLFRPAVPPGEPSHDAATRPFFWETVAALEVAATLSDEPRRERLTARGFPTCLGSLHFADDGLLLGAGVNVVRLSDPRAPRSMIDQRAR